MAARKISASSKTPRTTAKTVAARPTDTVNAAVGTALGVGASLAATIKISDRASGALAWQAYSLRTLGTMTVPAMAAALGVSESAVKADITAGRWLNSMGPAYAVKAPREALAVAHEPSDTRKPLDSLKGKPLADAIHRAYVARTERQRAASAARKGGQGTARTDAGEKVTPTGTAKTDAARLAGAGAFLAAVKGPVTGADLAALATVAAHVTRLVATADAAAYATAVQEVSA